MSGAQVRLAALLLAAWATAAPAAPPAGAAPVGRALAARLDAFVAAAMRDQQVPGLALAVLRQGVPVYVRGYGVASLEWPNRVRPDTRFQIGSLGKQFTAVAVTMLAEEGRLDLDAPLARYLPEVPAAWSGVTVRRMLAHQSGIPQLEEGDRHLLDLRHEYTDEEYLRLASAQPLDFEPGSDAAYSDTAYVLLGIVINRVTGQFYGDLLERRIFAPLGMARTRVISDADIVPGRASGYELDGAGGLRNQAFVSAALNRTADGSLYSTVLDLARWDAALYGDRVLPQRVLERMWRVEPLAGGEAPLYHYGHGWEINQVGAETVIEYDGNWQGFQAAMARYPGRGLTVIVLSNRSLARVQAIAHGIAERIEPSLRRPVPEPDPDPARTTAFRALLEAARADQDGARPAALTPRRWHALGRDLRGVGALGALDYAGTSGAARRVVYRAALAEMVEYYTVDYARDGAVSAIELEREF